MAEEIPSSEVLTQSEVESILASIQAGGEAIAGLDEEIKVISGEKAKTSHKSLIQTLDYRSPVFISPSQMRRLRIKHENFIRTLAGSLSLYLRMEFNIQMSRLETMPFKQMLDVLPMPSHLTLFKVMPQNYMCLFEISPRLGLTILDRMMGGPGHSIKSEREFTDIETTVLKNYIQLVLKEYVESWLQYDKLNFEIVQHESTARFLHIAEPTEIVLYLEMEARFGDCVAGMRFIVPFRPMEYLIDALMAEVSSEKNDQFNKITLPEDLESPTYNIPVPIRSYWKGLSMTLNEIQNLEAGDVLILNKDLCKLAIVELGNIPKFLGYVDRSGLRVDISIDSKIND